MKQRGRVDTVLYSDSTDESLTPDFNPDILCKPKQVPPLSWDSSFLLLFACLFYCNCDLWGREGDSVPWLRTSWEWFTSTEVLWAARRLAGENTPVSPASSASCQEAADLLATLHASSVFSGTRKLLWSGGFPWMAGIPHVFLGSKAVALEFPESRAAGWLFFLFFFSFGLVFYFRKQSDKGLFISPVPLPSKNK